MAIKANNDRSTGLLVSAYDLLQVFGIEPFRQWCRAHQVAEHDGELTALRCRGRCCGDWCS
jgi:hypothetical protein